MNPRHEARTLAVQFLFQRDFNRGDLEEALTDFWGERETPERVKTFAVQLIRGVETHKTALDRLLTASAEHWDPDRMAATDRNIMRVALYEMTQCDDIPPVVSIDEAVNLAKEFSGLESGRFVNGILDRVARGLDRPARAAARPKTKE